MQEPPLNEEKTVLGNVEEGVGEIKSKLDRFNEISALMAEPDADFDALMEEMGQLQEAIDAANAWDLDSQLEQAMEALRCPPADMPVTHLSGGERRRVALCKLLLQKPDLLLLDEPTNHLDVEAITWLANHLKSRWSKNAGGLMVVTHDRWFLDRICTHILAFEGNGEVVFFEGGFSDYEINKARRLGNEEIKKGRYRKLMEE